MIRYCLTWYFLVITCLAAEIPERPEKLVFPELTYEPPNPADYRVELSNGPVAYVVEDRELPLVNVVVYVRTGQYLEPTGKVGLADLAGTLLVRGGTESKSAEELEERLDFLAAEMSSNVGETQGSVRLNLLAKDLDEGLGILREVLASPRFQDDKLRLYKDQTLQAMKQRNDDSADIESRDREWLAFGANFWATRQPTAATIDAIRREDLVTFHRVVAASGDFSRPQMVEKLEKLFAQWPFAGEVPPPVPTNTTLAAPGVYLVDKDVNQGRVSLLLRGLQREDPDYFAVTIMNDIFGGGGFTSRLVNRIRSDEGLAYSAGSIFPGGVYYPAVFRASFQSKSRTVAYAASIVLEEMKRLLGEAVSEDELNTSKRSYIDSFPQAFATKAQVAARFADDEFTGRYARDPHYWRNYRQRIEAVTGEDVRRVATKWLKPQDVVILAVGQRDEILKGDPDHPVKLTDLTSGGLIQLPLRDPLTLEPLK
jgi:predicted Zn-dependent peptidase